MEIIDRISDSIKDFVDRTNRLTLGLLGALIILILITLILILIQISTKPKILNSDTTFVTEDPFIMPQDMTLTEDYYFSRVTDDKWSSEETDRWFSKPDASNINELGTANDALVDELLGAAP